MDLRPDDIVKAVIPKLGAGPLRIDEGLGVGEDDAFMLLPPFGRVQRRGIAIIEDGSAAERVDDLRRARGLLIDPDRLRIGRLRIRALERA